MSNDIIQNIYFDFVLGIPALNGIRNCLMENIPNAVAWYDDHPHLTQHSIDIQIVDIHSKKIANNENVYYDIHYLMSARYFVSDDENVMEDIVDIKNLTALQKQVYESAKSLKTILSHVVVDGEILDIRPFYDKPDYQIAYGVLHCLFKVRESISELHYKKSIQKLDNMPAHEKLDWLSKLPHLRIGENN